MSATDRSKPGWRQRRREAQRPALGQPRDHDQAAAHASRAGDLRAWEYIIRRHQELVFRSAYLATRDSAAAEEATKGAFTRAYRSLGSLESGESLRPWLLGITATSARVHLREVSMRRDAKMADPDPCPRLPATPVDPGLGIPRPTPREHEVLVDAFDGLADDDRHFMAARYSFDLTRAEAAARFALPPEQLDGRLAASVGRLRSRVTDLATVSSPGYANRRAPGDPGIRVDRLALLGDDQLGAVAVAAVMSELPWTPDVAPSVCTRLAREAAAYPEQFGAPPGAPSGAGSSVPGASHVARSESRGPRMSAASATRGGVVSLQAAAIVVGALLVGFSFVAGNAGLESPAELGDRVGSWLGQAEPQRIEGTSVVVKAGQAASLYASVPGTGAGPAGAAENASFERTRAEPPRLSIVGAHTLPNGDVGTRVSVEWAPAAGFGPVAETHLEQSVDADAWDVVSSSEAVGPVEVDLRAATRYSLRIRSVDGVGGEVVSPHVGVKVVVRDPRSRRLALGADEWLTRSGKTIKHRLIATSPDASLSTRFFGSGVALVGPAGPDRGAIGVRIDEGPWAQDDLRTWETSGRTVVFSDDLDPGRHSLDLRAETDGVAVDGVIIVRTRPS